MTDTDTPNEVKSEELLAAVERALPESGFSKFVDIADQLNEIPWDILSACRELVRRERAVEGRDKQKASFREA